MTEKRGRGRPREFDADVVLERLAEVFLREGYHGASLDGLSAAAGLKRPSLYAAFGDKRAMYLSALARARQRMREALTASVTREGTARECLSHFLEATLAEYGRLTSGRGGCLVLCTGPAVAATDDGVAAMIDGTLNDLRVELEACLSSKGVSESQHKAAAIAHLLPALALGVRTGADTRTIQETILELAA